MLAVAPHTAAISALAQVSWEVPIVAVEAGPDNDVPTVAIDQFGGASAATKHLLDLGHRNVLHIAGPADWQEAQIRLAGWRETLLEAGVRPLPPFFGDWSPGSGYEIGKQIAAMSDVTAVFVSNDQMALGVLRALDEAGRRVPEDVSIVGFDAIPEAEFFTPPLTTVRQDFIAVGRRGFELLRRQIEDGDQVDGRVVIPFELLIRASTRPPA